MLKFKTEVINYLFILLGSAVMAFGIVGFLSPNHIATGGTAGLAIVLNHVFNLSIGTWMALINIPLLLLTLKSLGKRFAIKTIVCIAAIVVLVDFFAKVIQLPALSANLMLATLYGGVTIGVGLGLIFKGGASAGGASILAKLFNEKFGIKSSTVILILDAIIVASAGFVFHSIELALWSLISIYVASKLIDTILVGAQSQKIVHISSIKNLHELSKIISDNLGISGTIIKGNDLQISEYKDIIFIMIDKNRLNELKQLVLQYDKDVKMVVMEATEILGK
ncbi:MAG: YitT family protein [Bacteroidetes bacterium]|nr:YitT family protein [Bacteroidota bacterium]